MHKSFKTGLNWRNCYNTQVHINDEVIRHKQLDRHLIKTDKIQEKYTVDLSNTYSTTINNVNMIKSTKTLLLMSTPKHIKSSARPIKTLAHRSKFH